MIVDKYLADLNTDAPPSYDDLVSPQEPSSSQPSSPFASSSQSHVDPTLQIKKLSTKKSKGPTSWFPFTASRTAKEVRITVLNLIRDLVKHPFPAASPAILDSCAEACVTHGISFASLLQQKSVEDHTPIYWAIVKRPAEPTSPTEHDLLTALLTRAAPLTESTVSEMRLACLVTNDQVLFQRLRLSPAFSPLSGTDEILLGANIPPDMIRVEDVASGVGAFIVTFEVPLFQRRMRISRRIVLEFIARGRMWSFSFSTVLPENDPKNDPNVRANKKPVGSWVVALGLLEHSPSTWVDSRLTIVEHSPSTPTPSLIDTPIPDASRPSLPRKKSKPNPTISLRLKTGSSQLAPPIPKTEMPSEIVVPLSDSLMGQSLQYEYV
ncbi:hypothetical protein SERLADRAFT_463545 [Serpula lacrymans var. lacrymans S7.9]|uniref:Uncharacterized protein n=1 Tax=Serpula lacrymans var. lacrymans (strain S7.9) TaxID=578457 RepID=F8NSK4_SERL9|nr:uncharacterized protein SERLADRAFT_463545 [Serpula lacrymans var. lacrymans S7.9]EGO26459.1 hypothetical protein SERLADRAFT_463545 [Serpula lacrymans var. lacrymans S7.9]